MPASMLDASATPSLTAVARALIATSSRKQADHSGEPKLDGDVSFA